MKKTALLTAFFVFLISTARAQNLYHTLHENCSVEIAKYCYGKTGYPLVKCLQTTTGYLSSGCVTIVSAFDNISETDYQEWNEKDNQQREQTEDMEDNNSENSITREDNLYD